MNSVILPLLCQLVWSKFGQARIIYNFKKEKKLKSSQFMDCHSIIPPTANLLLSILHCFVYVSWVGTASFRMCLSEDICYWLLTVHLIHSVVETPPLYFTNFQFILPACEHSGVAAQHRRLDSRYGVRILCPDHPGGRHVRVQRGRTEFDFVGEYVPV